MILKHSLVTQPRLKNIRKKRFMPTARFEFFFDIRLTSRTYGYAGPRIHIVNQSKS